MSIDISYNNSQLFQFIILLLLLLVLQYPLHTLGNVFQYIDICLLSIDEGRRGWI